MSDPLHLEALSNAKEKVEVTSLIYVRRIVIEVIDHWIYRWIQVIAEVHPNWPDRRFIARPQTNRMRKVVEVACADLARHIGARLLVWLVKAEKTGKHIACILKHITHIVKHHKTDAIAHIGQRWRRQTGLRQCLQ